MKYIWNSVVCFLLATVSAWGGGLPEATKPFITEDTVAVAKLDLKNWNVDELVANTFEQLQKQLPMLFLPDNPAAKGIAQIQATVDMVSNDLCKELLELGIDSVTVVMEVRSKDGDENVVISVIFPHENPSHELANSIDELANVLPEADKMRENREVVISKHVVAWIFAEKTDTEGILETFEPVDRPDLEEGFTRVGECRLCVVVTPKKFPPIPETDEIPVEFLEAISTCESFSLGLDLRSTLMECNVISYAIFENEDAAEQALALKNTILTAVMADCPDDETRPVVDDCIDLVLEFGAYKQDGNVLSMNLRENGAAWINKNLGWLQSYTEYCAENREARADFDTAAEADRLAECIAPFTTAQTMLVAHVDLTRFNLGDMSEVTLNQLEKIFPRTFSSDIPIMDSVRTWEAFVAGFETKRAQFLAAGAKDIFCLVNIPGPDSPTFLYVIPVNTDSPKRLAKLQKLEPLVAFLPEDDQEAFLSEFQAGYYEGNIVIIPAKGFDSESEAAKFIQSFCEELQASVVDRPQFRDGFALGSAECFQLVFAMNPVVREQIASGLNGLEGLTRPSDRLVARGLDVVTFAADPHTGVLSLQAYSKSEAAAQNLVILFDTWKRELLDGMLAASENEPTMPVEHIKKVFDMIQLIQDGRRVTLYFEIENREGVQSFMTGVSITSMAILMPAIQQARKTAQRMQCTNNLRQIGLAMLNYEDCYRHFPPAYTVDKDGKPLHSWRVLILPFIEQNALYEQIRLDEPWDSEWNSQFHNITIPMYQDPRLTLEPGQTVMSVVVGKGTIFDSNSRETCRLSKIIDGASNTILIVEKKEPFCWMDPTADIQLEELGDSVEDSPILSFDGSWNCAASDCSSHNLVTDIPGKALRYLFIRNDETETSPLDYSAK